MALATRWQWAGPVAVLALLLAARLPALRDALPFLGLFGGPLGLGLVAWALVVAALASRRAAPRPAPAARTVWLTALALHLAAGLWYASGSRAAGDEPHYLLMAQSLWREGDLDLRDNFARGDFREYVPDLDRPHYGAPRADGRPYPAHSPGLPLLLAPAYAAGGRLACVALMAVLASLVVVQGHRLALLLGAGGRAALFGAALLAGPPLLFYAFHLYTETPSALAVATAVVLLLGRTDGRAAFGAALCASALPWLHVKMVPAAAALALVALARLRGRALAVFLVTATAAALAFLGYYRAVFGVATPLALYGGGLPRGDVVADPLRAALGLLLDRSFGLLPVAPAFGLGLLLLCGAWRARGAWLVLAVGAAALVPPLAWRMWWGGQCPPARMLVPLAPLAAALVAVRLERWPAGLARARAALLLAGHGLAAFALWEPARMRLLNRRDRPTRLWEDLAGEVSPGRYLPSLVYAPSEEWRVAWLWVAALALVLALDWAAQRRPGADRLWSSPLPLLALGLVLALAVDFWARAGRLAPGPPPAPVAVPAQGDARGAGP